MAFSSVIRAMGRSLLAEELISKLNQQRSLYLNGIARLPKGLVTSALAQQQQRPMLVVTATLEEAGRWAAQLEAMGWQTVQFYPTSESSPYEPFDSESEMTWGQLQVLAELQGIAAQHPSQTMSRNGSSANESSLGANPNPPGGNLAVVATERSLQPHLPPVDVFRPYCVTLTQGMELNLGSLSNQLAQLGYERVPLVEMEGQWSRRGDIIDVFPVSSELPVRLELFGDELERIREFDALSQRSLDRIPKLTLTATTFSPIVLEALHRSLETTIAIADTLEACLSPEDWELFQDHQPVEGMRRFLGLALASLRLCLTICLTIRSLW